MLQPQNQEHPYRAGAVVRLCVFVFVFLGSLYMLFYTADYKEFGDSAFIFNITASLARYGDTQFDLLASIYPDRPDNRFFPERLYPLFTYDEDLLSPTLAVPLYALAYQLPGIGLVHAAWLLNVILSALTGVVMVLYALTLGYSTRTAAAAALTLGTGTLCLPYARSFLQEPSVTLVTLLLALLLHRWRASQYRAIVYVPVIGVLLFALLNGKLSAPVALPALLLVMLPPIHARWLGAQWAHAVALLMVMFGVTLVAFVPLNDLLNAVSRWVSLPYFDTTYTATAIRTYFFGIGAGLWATSPPALLALPGAAMLINLGRTRYVWVGVLMTLGYTFGYGLFRGEPWFGSVTWPVRFLLPVIPFLIITALPVIEHVVHQRRAYWLRLVFVVLLVYALWINLNAVSYRWDTYDKLLPAGVLMTQGEAAFNPAWLPWVLLPRLWGERPFDFAWVRTNQPVFPLMFVTLVFVAGRCIWRTLDVKARVKGGNKRHWLLTAAFGLPLMFAAAVYVGLRLIYIDPLYLGQSRELWAMLRIINAETRQPDMVFITSSDHIAFMLNYGRSPHARLTGLTFQPGERYSPDQTPLVTGTINPYELVSSATAPLLRAAAAQRERLWLLTDLGPFHPWAVRAVERLMVYEYYPLREFETAPHVRLMAFATPEASVTTTVEDRIVPDVMFGESMRLDNAYLPGGLAVQPGEMLTVGLYWRINEAADDYTVALFLASSGGGAVVTQAVDSFPAGGFIRTSEWPRDWVLRDNRALQVPLDVPPGEYRLWVRLYHRNEDGELLLLPVTRGAVLDETIAVLPMTISVTPVADP